MWKNKKKPWQSMKAYFKDLSLGVGGDPQPKHSNKITSISLKDLYYNMPLSHIIAKEKVKKKKEWENK